MGRLVASLLLLAALSGCSVHGPRTDKLTDPKAAQVLEGDVLVVRGETIRLANAAAPALPPGAHCWAEAALAVQSAKATEQLIASAHTVSVTRDGRDGQGRTLGRISLDGRRDLGEALVFTGVAARPGARPMDWCGPPDFHAAEGPGLDTGPKANVAFMGWIDAETARRSEESIKALLADRSGTLEGASGF
jgi:endonuclease YncB( thermonuclease family)